MVFEKGSAGLIGLSFVLQLQVVFEDSAESYPTQRVPEMSPRPGSRDQLRIDRLGQNSESTRSNRLSRGLTRSD